MENYPLYRIHAPDMIGFGRKLKRYLLGLAMLGGLFAAACTQGSYPVDIFYEMHYQQSFKAQEPPSLSAPEGSVAWFPPPQSTSFDSGRHLFTVNCSMCHGTDAKGSASPQGPGPVLRTLTVQYGYQEQAPTDLTLFTPDFIQTVVEFTAQPGRSRYFGDDSIMPPFGKLLSANDIRAIAEYIATLPSTTAAPTVGEQPAPTPTPAPSPTPTVSAEGGHLALWKSA
jgi:mono/diheme cytochrome c family protein